MRQLRLVGLAEDGGSLVLESPTGESYRLPVDDRVRAACRGDLTRLGQIEIEMDNPLRPREIQMRVRAGESAEQVAASSGMPLDRVLRFASAVLQERARVVAQARGTAVRPPAADSLGPLVEDRLVSRGTDPATLAWDAWRADEGGWVVRLAWRHGGERDYSASWSFDLARRALQPADPAAEQLSAEEFHARTITAVTPLAVAARAADEAAARPRPADPARHGGAVDDAARPRPADPARRGVEADRGAGGRGGDRPAAPGTGGGEAGDEGGGDEPTTAEPAADEAARTRFEEIRAGGRRDRRPGRDPRSPDPRSPDPRTLADRAGGRAGAGPRPEEPGPEARPRPGDARFGGAPVAGSRPDGARSERSRADRRSGGARPVGRAERDGARAPRDETAGEDDEPQQVAAAGGATIPGLVVNGESRESDEDRARRATVPSWDDILLGVRRRH